MNGAAQWKKERTREEIKKKERLVMKKSNY